LGNDSGGEIVTKRETQKDLKRLDKNIGAFLRKMREEAEYNQTELAPLLGLDQSALSRVESGKQQLTAGQLVTFCHAVGLESLTIEEIA
jgi:transcriptional regulator with XRE-family HTH domain